MDDDLLDLGDLFRRLRRRLHWLVAGAALGGAAAVAVAALMPPSYESTAKILIRDGETTGLMSSLTGSPLETLFKSAGRSGLATEVEILTSRPVLEEVVDSLGLQWRVVQPRSTGTSEVFAAVRASHDSGEPVRYRFTRDGGRYLVEGGGGRWTAQRGERLALPHGEVTLRPGLDLATVEVQLESRRAAVRRIDRALKTKEATSDLVNLTFKAHDPATAAAVPAFLMTRYLAQRTHADRNANRRQLTFLEAQEDSLRHELAAAEVSLRDYQERSGTFDAVFAGERTMERALQVRGQSEDVEVELRALNALLATGAAGASSNELAAYPTFLRNGAINGLLNRIIDTRARRTEHLEWRTEADPDVQVLTANLQAYERELLEVSRAYRDGLVKQQRELARALVPYQATLAAIPEHLQAQLRREREVKRLTETLLVIQAQLVQTRLAVVGEGGEVRAIEPPLAPEKPKWPKPLPFLLIGLVAGAFAGMAGAVVRGYTDPVLRSEEDARDAAGLPATAFPAGDPLLLGGLNGARSVVLVPAGRAAAAVTAAEAIVAGARLQGMDAALLDATAATLDGTAVATRLESLEASHPLGVVAVPGLERAGSLPLLLGGRKVLLVAEAGWTRAEALRRAATLLARIEVPVAGVLLLQPPPTERFRLSVFRHGGRTPARVG